MSVVEGGVDGNVKRKVLPSLDADSSTVNPCFDFPNVLAIIKSDLSAGYIRTDDLLRGRTKQACGPIKRW